MPQIATVNVFHFIVVLNRLDEIPLPLIVEIVISLMNKRYDKVLKTMVPKMRTLQNIKILAVCRMLK